MLLAITCAPCLLCHPQVVYSEDSAAEFGPGDKGAREARAGQRASRPAGCRGLACARVPAPRCCLGGARPHLAHAPATTAAAAAVRVPQAAALRWGCAACTGTSWRGRSGSRWSCTPTGASSECAASAESTYSGEGGERSQAELHVLLPRMPARAAVRRRTGHRPLRPRRPHLRLYQSLHILCCAAATTSSSSPAPTRCWPGPRCRWSSSSRCGACLPDAGTRTHHSPAARARAGSAGGPRLRHCWRRQLPPKRRPRRRLPQPALCASLPSARLQLRGRQRQGGGQAGQGLRPAPLRARRIEQRRAGPAPRRPLAASPVAAAGAAPGSLRGPGSVPNKCFMAAPFCTTRTTHPSSFGQRPFIMSNACLPSPPNLPLSTRAPRRGRRPPARGRASSGRHHSLRRALPARYLPYARALSPLCMFCASY